MKLIPKAKGGLSFSQAFAQARKAGLKTFKWRGGTYGTQLASETKVPSKVFANTQNANNYNIPGFNKIIKQEKMKVNGKWKTVNRAYYQSKEFPGKTLTYDQAVNVARNRGNFNGLEIGIVAHRTDIQNGKNRAQGDKATGYIPVVKDNEYRPSMNDYLNGFKPTKELAQKAAEAGQITGTKNPVWQNYTTGEYYMTHPKTGQVMYSSSDEKVLQDPSLWTNYHTGLNGDENQAWDSFDNNRGALITAVDRNARMNQDINAPFHYNVQNDGKVVPAGKLTTKQVVQGMNNAKQAWVNVINQANPASVVNHTVTGGIKLAFDPNYKFDQYARGFDFNHMNQDVGQVQGLGDLFDIENPTLRFTSNFINPVAVASSLNIKTTGTKQGFTNGRTTQIKVANPRQGGFSRQVKPQYQQFKGGAYPRGAHGKYAGNGGFQGGRNAQYNGQYNYGGGSHTENLPWVGDYWRTPATINVGYTPVFYNADAAPYSRVFETNILPQPYSVDYEPTINNDPYRAQMIYDASKPVAGSAGKDVRQTGNVTVGTSNDTTNELRSRGRRASTSKRQKNKQSIGKTDQTQ